MIVPCAFTEATLVARLTNVAALALGPESVGANVVPMSTMRIFSADEPKPALRATVIGADPVTPSATATMLAVPKEPPPVTTPCAVTVAIDALSDDNVIALTRIFPSASLAVAVA